MSQRLGTAQHAAIPDSGIDGRITMRAVVITTKGGPEVLIVRQVPDPVPGPEEVLVDVVTSAINRADLLQRRACTPGRRPLTRSPAWSSQAGWPRWGSG